MARKGNTAILDKIRRKANQLRKGTNMKYTTALKKAGAEYRSKNHKSPAKKKPVHKRAVSKVFVPKPVTASRALVERTFAGGSVTQHVKAAQSIIGDKIARLIIKKENATTKREKKAIQKEISREQRSLRNPFSK